jgi:hypothetical protein
MAQCWALWTTRNKFTIEAKFSHQPADCVFKILLNLQLWRPLQRPNDVALLDEMAAILKRLFSDTYSSPQPLSVPSQSILAFMPFALLLSNFV